MHSEPARSQVINLQRFQTSRLLPCHRLGFYTDEAMRLPPNGSMIKGIALIRDSMKSFREKNDYVLDAYSPPQIQVSGDLALTHSTFEEHWTSKANGRWKTPTMAVGLFQYQFSCL